LCILSIFKHALAAKASEGLLGLSFEMGLKVLRLLLEEDVTTVAGVKGKRDKSREAYRHGYEQTKVICGGEKVSVNRPVRGQRTA
jgi:hypothetical protein